MGLGGIRRSKAVRFAKFTIKRELEALKTLNNGEIYFLEI